MGTDPAPSLPRWLSLCWKAFCKSRPRSGTLAWKQILHFYFWHCWYVTVFASIMYINIVPFMSILIVMVQITGLTESARKLERWSMWLLEICRQTPQAPATWTRNLRTSSLTSALRWASWIGLGRPDLDGSGFILNWTDILKKKLNNLLLKNIIDAHGLKNQGRGYLMFFAKIPRGVEAFRKNCLGGGPPISGLITFLQTARRGQAQASLLNLAACRSYNP